MKKNITSLLLFLLAILFTFSYSYADDINISSEAAILIDQDTGEILYEKNAHKPLYPASTTKIMTGILAIENGNLNDIVTIDKEMIQNIDGSHIALEPDEKLGLKDLLYALLIESANDSAVAIAKHISGNIDSFIDLMNKKAKELGAKNTHFENPNGLPNENHVTTAYDLAMISKYAMKNEIFKQIVKNYTYTIPPTNKKDTARYLKSSNRLLYSTKKINVDGKNIPIKYEGITGIKSGYTVAAQQCLVSSATKGKRNLICVVLKANGRNIYVDSHKLLDYGFNNFEKVNLSFKNEFIDNFKIKNGNNSFAPGIIQRNISATIPKGKKYKIQKNIISSNTIKAPIKIGQNLGKIEYFFENKKLGDVNIISTVDIQKKDSIIKIIFNLIIKKWWIILIILLLFCKIKNKYRKIRRKKKRKIEYKKI